MNAISITTTLTCTGFYLLQVITIKTLVCFAWNTSQRGPRPPTGATLGAQPLYTHTQWVCMTKINDDEMRNAFRFRRAPRRTMQKNRIDAGVLEQLTAIGLGLTDDPRKEVSK